jgi:hypothetical protein
VDLGIFLRDEERPGAPLPPLSQRAGLAIQNLEIFQRPPTWQKSSSSQPKDALIQVALVNTFSDFVGAANFGGFFVEPFGCFLLVMAFPPS